MSDEDLREAERLAAYGEHESVRRYMALACRSGLIGHDALSVANACGCRCAAEVLGSTTSVPSSLEPRELFEQLFNATGRPGVCSLMVILARRAWEMLGDVPPEAIGADIAVQAANDLLRCPCETHASIAEDAGYEMTALGENPEVSVVEAGGLSFYAAWETADAYRRPHEQAQTNHLGHFLRSLQLAYGSPDSVARSVNAARSVLARQELGSLVVCNTCPAASAGCRVD